MFCSIGTEQKVPYVSSWKGCGSPLLGHLLVVRKGKSLQVKSMKLVFHHLTFLTCQHRAAFLQHQKMLLFARITMLINPLVQIYLLQQHTFFYNISSFISVTAFKLRLFSSSLSVKICISNKFHYFSVLPRSFLKVHCNSK